jgi:hypothetical protein
VARIGVLALVLAFALAACSGDGGDAAQTDTAEGGTARTEVVHWSPFDADGKVDSTLDTRTLGNGECTGRSLTIASPGLRCKAGRWVLDPCWRNSGGVVCAGFPWDTELSTIRVPPSKFPAVNIEAETTRPWAIELADGHRCRILQSSHVTVKVHGRPLHVDYDCDDGLVLLRNLTRGRVWRVATAKWNHGRYAVHPGATVRRAYCG